MVREEVDVIIESVQYRIKCDSIDCLKSTGHRTDLNALECEAVYLGWEVQADQSSPVKLFRCPACVRLRRFPPGWRDQK